MLRALIITLLTLSHFSLLAERQHRFIIEYQSVEALNSVLNEDGSVGVGTFNLDKFGMDVQLVRQMEGAQIIVSVDDVRETEKVLAELLADNRILHVEEDTWMEAYEVPNDPLYNQQWHYFDSVAGINLEKAWDFSQGKTSDGQSIVVAVIDTGILSHEDLKGQYLPGYDFINDAAIANDGNGRDADPSDTGDWTAAGECGSGQPIRDRNSTWHGTHVAGTIAAATNNNIGLAGIAPKAKILPVRALGKCGGYMSDIVDAMRWAGGMSVTGVPRNPNPAKVLNLSLGGAGACSAYYQKAIDDLKEIGVLTVVAAGNSSANASDFKPASCENVLTVAALNREGGRSYYSNFGQVVGIAAPGGDLSNGLAGGILSTLNSGTRAPGSDEYSFYQGTSMATPHVAGAAALLYAVKPNAKPEDIINWLQRGSRAFISRSADECTTTTCGSGMLDVGRSMSLAISGSTEEAQELLLQNGDQVQVSGRAGDLRRYKIELPKDMNFSSFKITLSGGSGDADLFVRQNSQPNPTLFDAKSERQGNNELIEILSPSSGMYYIAVRGFTDFNDATLEVRYNLASDNALSTTLFSEKITLARSKTKMVKLEVAPGAKKLIVSALGGTGDIDLYMKAKDPASTTNHDYKSIKFGNQDEIIILNPLGDYYLLISAFQASQNVQVKAVLEYEQGNSAPSGPFKENKKANLSIPDNNHEGISSEMMVANKGIANIIRVSVDISHSYQGDLKVSLRAPSGELFNLKLPDGMPGGNLKKTFEINARNIATQGSWKLRVIDTAPLDTGILNSWTLEIQ